MSRVGSDDSGVGEEKTLLSPNGASTTTHNVEVQYGTTSFVGADSGKSDGDCAHNSQTHKKRVLTKSSSSSGSFLESFRSSTRDLLRSSQRSLSRRCSVTDSGGTASIADEVFNLTKNIVGSAALAIPGGIAAFGNAPQAVVPAVVIILLMGLINAYTFGLIGRVCAITGATSYGQAWELSVGNRGSSIVAFVCTFKPALGNLAYSMILADAFKPLLETVAGIQWGRTKVLWIITVLLIWPLCLLKNLKVLAPFSILGLVGMVFITLAMVVRYFDGTYNRMSPHERFIEDVPTNLQPEFGSVGISGIWNVQVLTLVCMLATAYVAHYNAPRFYIELKNNTMKRYSTVIGISYIASASFYVILGVVGFLTFGGNSSSFILNNYSSTDILATASRAAIIVAILFTYPIVFVGVRDGILDLIHFPVEYQTAINLNIISTLVLLVLTLMAESFTDLGIVLAFGGATLATAVIYIFPVLMFRSAVLFRLGDQATISQRKEVPFALGLMSFGIIMGCIGATLALTGQGGE